MLGLFTVKCAVTNFICRWSEKAIIRPSEAWKIWKGQRNFLLKLLQGGFHNLCHMRPGIVVKKDYFASSIESSLLNSLVHLMQLGCIQILPHCLVLLKHFLAYKILPVPANTNLFGTEIWLSFGLGPIYRSYPFFSFLCFISTWKHHFSLSVTILCRDLSLWLRVTRCRDW